MNSEPAITIGAIISAVAAVLTAATAFGLDLSEDQLKALLTALGAVLPIVGALIIRRSVFAPDTVAKKVDEAFVEGAAGGTKPKVGT